MSSPPSARRCTRRVQSPIQAIPSLSHISDAEATFYYAGLPSRPVLVARTGSTAWEAPSGPEAYTRLKELRIVGNHAINSVWEDDLALKVHAILHAKQVNWSSTDVVRIGYVDEPFADVILWIGVLPNSLTYEAGIEVARMCKGLLLEYHIMDVDVEIRESEVIPSSSLPLLQPTLNYDPTADVREPLTTSLGLTICSQSTSETEGTGGFFLCDGNESKRLLLVTTRHVVFPPNQVNNDLFLGRSDSEPAHNVLLLSDMSFKKLLLSIRTKIAGQELIANFHRVRIEKATTGGTVQDELEYANAESQLNEVLAGIVALTTFYQEISTYWAAEHKRILGHVIFSPPIITGVGSKKYTQDIAVIEIDATKIDPSIVTPNVIDLGFKFSLDTLSAMMNPNSENPPTFVYPHNRLLRLHGTIGYDEICRPPTCDERNDPCIMVLKRGRTSGLTVGRANNVSSYLRNYFGNDIPGVSKEWAILPFDQNSGAFSTRGDSGSVIVDGTGRIGGILTGGSGLKDSIDVTYATPIDFVLQTIHGNKSLAQSYIL